MADTGMDHMPEKVKLFFPSLDMVGWVVLLFGRLYQWQIFLWDLKKN